MLSDWGQDDSPAGRAIPTPPPRPRHATPLHTRHTRTTNPRFDVPAPRQTGSHCSRSARSPHCPHWLARVCLERRRIVRCETWPGAAANEVAVAVAPASVVPCLRPPSCTVPYCTMPTVLPHGTPYLGRCIADDDLGLPALEGCRCPAIIHPSIRSFVRFVRSCACPSTSLDEYLQGRRPPVPRPHPSSFAPSQSFALCLVCRRLWRV